MNQLIIPTNTSSGLQRYDPGSRSAFFDGDFALCDASA